MHILTIGSSFMIFSFSTPEHIVAELIWMFYSCEIIIVVYIDVITLILLVSQSVILPSNMITTKSNPNVYINIATMARN